MDKDRSTEKNIANDLQSPAEGRQRSPLEHIPGPEIAWGRGQAMVKENPLR